MRLLICAGMTGGGVYPAIAVLQALKGKTDEVLWVGSFSGMEQTLLKPYDLSFVPISAAGLHGVSLKSLPGNFRQLARGFYESRAIIDRFKPHVLFLTGGYLGVPLILAARKIPSVVFVPDIEPGFALRTILHFANIAALSTKKSLQYVRHKNKAVTGYPVREEIKKWGRKSGREFFHVADEEKILLVFGGSKGSRSINLAISHHLINLLAEMHIVHISGKEDWENVQAARESLESGLRKNYHIYPFLHDEMGAAFAAADLVVCRSGASTLGELPYFGLPAILVPYPYAWNYQQQNAQYLKENGGAVVLADELLEDRLEPEVRKLMHSRETLNKMKKAMKALSVENAAEKIAEKIMDVSRESVVLEESHG